MGIANALLRRMLLSEFFRAGFTANLENEPSGWLSRDPKNDDWIFWSTDTQQMYRKTPGDETEIWRPSSETKRECLHLGRLYEERMRLRS